MSDLEYIIETFDFLITWDERYQFIEELGNKLGSLPAKQKNNDNIVHGCASNVWIIGYVDKSDSGHLIFEAEAEQPIIRGLVYLILQVFANKTPEEILDTQLDTTLTRLHLDEHLSTQRHIGMYALVQKIKMITLPFSNRDSFETE